MFDDIKNKIIDYVFIISKQPVLLKDLLVANDLHTEKMRVDASKLGFRMDIAKAYKAFAMVAFVVIIPIALIGHMLLAKIDSHASIIASILLTALIFIYFNIFREKLVDIMTIRRIKSAWKNHFPYFPYDEYHEKVAKLYEQAEKAEISKKELEVYILDNLSKE